LRVAKGPVAASLPSLHCYLLVVIICRQVGDAWYSYGCRLGFYTVLLRSGISSLSDQLTPLIGCLASLANGKRSGLRSWAREAERWRFKVKSMSLYSCFFLGMNECECYAAADSFFICPTHRHPSPFLSLVALVGGRTTHEKAGNEAIPLHIHT
jgi:hypothetical protein